MYRFIPDKDMRYADNVSIIPPFFLLVCRIPRGIRIEDERRRDDNQNMRACAQHKKNTNKLLQKNKGGAALTSSREFAYLSTMTDARELNCRVRNGSGWNLSAMAA